MTPIRVWQWQYVFFLFPLFSYLDPLKIHRQNSFWLSIVQTLGGPLKNCWILTNVSFSYRKYICIYGCISFNGKFNRCSALRHMYQRNMEKILFFSFHSFHSISISLLSCNFLFDKACNGLQNGDSVKKVN